MSSGYVFDGKHKTKQTYKPDYMRGYKYIAIAASLFSLGTLLLYYLIGVRI